MSLRKLADFLLDAEDGVVLAALRIMFAGLMTLAFASQWPLLADIYGSAGVISVEDAVRVYPHRISVFLFDHPLWMTQLFFVIFLVAHLGWLFGFVTRITAILSVLGWASLVGRNPAAFGYPDQLFVAAGFLLAWVPTASVASLDAYFGRPGPTARRWHRWLVQLQLAVIYSGGAAAKWGTSWTTDGDAIYYAVTNPMNGRFSLGPWIAHVEPWLLRPATFLTLTWEWGFAAFVASVWLRELGSSRVPDLRRVYLSIGVLLHVGIMVFVFVDLFSLSMMALYLAFWNGTEIRGLRGPTGREKIRCQAQPDLAAASTKARSACVTRLAFSAFERTKTSMSSAARTTP